MGNSNSANDDDRIDTLDCESPRNLRSFYPSIRRPIRRPILRDFDPSSSHFGVFGPTHHYDTQLFSFSHEEEVGMKRENIAVVAEGHNKGGSIAWAKGEEKDNFPIGTWKCNKFVYDVLSEADACPLNKGQWPLQCADWVDGDYEERGWKRMPPGTAWEKGDVIVIKRPSANATGHCGIAVSATEVVAAGENKLSKGHHNLSGATVIRYVGKKN